MINPIAKNKLKKIKAEEIKQQNIRHQQVECWEKRICPFCGSTNVKHKELPTWETKAKCFSCDKSGLFLSEEM